MSLTKSEQVGETIYELMRRGKLDKEAFTRRMTQLDLFGSHVELPPVTSHGYY